MRVIKVGGRVQADAELPGAIAAAWSASEGSLCLVHGGGDEISTLQRAFGLEPRFVGGRRVTSTEDLGVLRMALSGVSNKRLVSRLLNAGVPALGLSGEDAALITATPVDADELGQVGTPTQVRTSLLRSLLREGYLPVISPLARNPADGSPLNVNGDDAAAAIAIAMNASELLLLADVPGVRDGANLLTALDPERAQALISAGTADGGMAAKLEAACHAARRGVASVRIGDLRAIEDPAAGTTITFAPSLV
jgi:acetylglutamate kinase